jgi:hypothetical protein
MCSCRRRRLTLTATAVAVAAQHALREAAAVYIFAEAAGYFNGGGGICFGGGGILLVSLWYLNIYSDLPMIPHIP